MGIVHKNFYNLNHEAIQLYLKGRGRYIADINMDGNVYSLWFQSKPNKKLGHTNYVMFYVRGEDIIVTGTTLKKVRPYLMVPAIKCKKCLDVIYSIWRHDYCSCSCGKVAIDGGRDYVRISAFEHEYDFGTIDFGKQTFKKG